MSTITAMSGEALEVKNSFVHATLTSDLYSVQGRGDRFAAELHQIEFVKYQPPGTLVGHGELIVRRIGGSDFKIVIQAGAAKKWNDFAASLEQRIAEAVPKVPFEATTTSGKPILRYAGGWPIVAPLRAQEQTLIDQNIMVDEVILGVALGSFHQVIVATERRLLVIKTGWQSGAFRGGQVSSYDYRQISSIDMRIGVLNGEFEVFAAGLPARNPSFDLSQAPNGVVFSRGDADLWSAFATKAREQQYSAANPNATAPARSSEPDIMEQLKKLGELHAAGVLRTDEFEAKKSELLARL